MDLNQKSIKDFNKIRAKKNKEVNLEKLFENDNYLVQTLKRTKRVLYENPTEEKEKNLNDTLKIINKDITLLKDPKIKEYNSENSLFKKKYTDFLKNSENTKNISFKDLMIHYQKSGYKIPNLDFDHNLFKINPLIEENSNKMTNYFVTENNKKITHKDLLNIKSLSYLNKLNNIVLKKVKKRKSVIKPKDTSNIKDKATKDEIKKLKKEIKNIKSLLRQMDIADKMNKTKYNYTYRNSHQLISSFGKVKSFKKLNSFNENPSFHKNIVFKNIPEIKEIKIEPSKNENKNELIENKINDNICKTQTTKNINKPINDYIENKFSQSTGKNSTFYRNENSSNLTGRNFKFNLSNKTAMPKLPLALKTDINFHNKKKQGHRTKLIERNKLKEELALFSRTQVKDKKLNKYYSTESRNKSGNINNFSNKTEFFDFAYRKLKKGDFDDIYKLVRKYLKEIEGKNDDEIEKILMKYDYKNFKVNLKELEYDIQKKEIDKKTEKIYLNNFISKRVLKPLENMRKEEDQISRLNKIITAIGNNSE